MQRRLVLLFDRMAGLTDEEEAVAAAELQAAEDLERAKEKAEEEHWRWSQDRDASDDGVGDECDEDIEKEELENQECNPNDNSIHNDVASKKENGNAINTYGWDEDEAAIDAITNGNNTDNNHDTSMEIEEPCEDENNSKPKESESAYPVPDAMEDNPNQQKANVTIPKLPRNSLGTIVQAKTEEDKVGAGDEAEVQHLTA